jgi:hypothetical protein
MTDYAQESPRKLFQISVRKGFWGIISQDPGVSKSHRLQIQIFQFSFNMMGGFSEVLNLNRLYLLFF